MKHLHAILAVLLLTVSASQAQTTIEYRSPYRDLRPVPCQLTVERNNQGAMNGTYTLKGSDDLKGSIRSDRQQYSETRHYSNGVVSGRFSQSYSHSGSGNISGRYTISHDWSVNGSFANGLPDGTWVFDITTRLNSSSEREHTHLKETVVFDNGRVNSITDQNGNYISVGPDNKLTGTGTLKDGTRVVLHNSIVTNNCVGLTGDTKPLSDEQTFMLRKLLDGEWTVFDLSDRGYTIDWQEAFLSQWARLAEHADRYARLSSIAPQCTLPSYSIRIGRLREVRLVDDDKAVEYYHQRPNKFHDMITTGCFQGPYGKRYFGSTAAQKVLHCWAQDQRQVLARKLGLISKVMMDDTWDQCLLDCVEGTSPMLDLIAWQRSSSGLSEEETYREAARLIKDKFDSLYPVCGFTIDSVAWFRNQGARAFCTIHRLAKDSVGYESFKVEMQTNLDGYLLIGRMEPYSYRRVQNLWDTVYRFEAQVAQRHKDLVYKMGTIKDWREPYVEYYDNLVADHSSRPEVRLADLQGLDSLQQQLAANIPVLSKIDMQHAQIRNMLRQFKRLSRNYQSFYQGFSPEWDDETSRLQQLQDYQERLLRQFRAQNLAEVERQAKRGEFTFEIR